MHTHIHTRPYTHIVTEIVLVPRSSLKWQNGYLMNKKKTLKSMNIFKAHEISYWNIKSEQKCTEIWSEKIPELPIKGQ